MRDHIEIRDLKHLKELFANRELLDRKDVHSLIERVEQAPTPFVMAVDAPWGTGKTVAMDILRVHLEDKGFKCIRFNAWKCDYAPDPLVPLMADIGELFSDPKKGKAKKLMGEAKKKANAFALSSISVGVPGVSATASKKSNNLIDDFKNQRQLLMDTREKLSDAIAELLTNKEGEENTPNKLVFFIDELDRCRPTFAIELLERVKHIFDIPNIVFVLSLDKKQLEASIKSVYGAEFDANAYLHRFINLEYLLPNLPAAEFIKIPLRKFGLSNLENDNFPAHFAVLADNFALPLRNQERCIARLYVSMPAIDEFDVVFIAFLLCLRSNLTGKELLKSFANGEMSAGDMMGEIKNLPEGNTTNMLHVHLLLADLDQRRAKKEVKEMQQKRDILAEEIYARPRKLSNEEMGEKMPMHRKYRAITDLYDRLAYEHSFRFNKPGRYLAYMMKKIDLTANIR